MDISPPNTPLPEQSDLALSSGIDSLKTTFITTQRKSKFKQREAV